MVDRAESWLSESCRLVISWHQLAGVGITVTVSCVWKNWGSSAPLWLFDAWCVLTKTKTVTNS